MFFPLMAILKDRVRFLVDPLILRTLRFHGLCPDQLPPNFHRVVSSVSQLNDLYGLHLNHHDINFMFSLCGNQRSGYYIKVMDTMVRLISCLPDSNRNSVGEYVRVSGNWFTNKLTCPTLPKDIGRYHPHLSYFVPLSLIFCYLFTYYCDYFYSNATNCCSLCRL